MILSVIFSVVFAAAVTYGATTISTNINTGGTLTVSGASSLNGNVTLGDVAGDVILSTGQLQASSTALLGETLVLKNSTSATTAVEGGVYYDSSSKVIKLYDGSAWYTVGTTTSGLTLSGNRLQLADLNHYMTFGTTTQQGLSMLTLEATSTVAIPLTIVAETSQTADTFRILNDASSKLLYVNSAGGLFGSSTAQFTGVLTTYGGVTLGDAAADAITLTGNASTTNALTVGGNLYINGFATTTASNGNIDTAGKLTAVNASTTRITASDYASTTSLIVGGNGSTMSGLIFGYCTIPTVTINASSTGYAVCDSSTGGAGIRSGDRVMVMATSSLPNNFILQAASSTAANTISVRLYNTGYDNGTGQGASDATGVNAFNFIGIR